MCDEHFFFASVEDCTEAAIGDLAKFDDGADLVRAVLWDRQANTMIAAVPLSRA